jgi:hypothetical protein
MTLSDTEGTNKEHFLAFVQTLIRAKCATLAKA